MEEEVYHGGVDLGEEMPEELYDDGQEMEVEEAEVLPEADEKQAKYVVLPRGTYLEEYYQPPEIERALYLKERTREAYQTTYEEFEEMDPSRFVHTERNMSVNWYPEDARVAFELVYKKAGIKTWLVVNGTQGTKQGLTSAHTAGLAMDVAVSGYEEARRLADAAYLVGLRAIAIQGCRGDEGGYVHLDIGPAAQWSIDGKVYRGPGI